MSWATMFGYLIANNGLNNGNVADVALSIQRCGSAVWRELQAVKDAKLEATPPTGLFMRIQFVRLALQFFHGVAGEHGEWATTTITARVFEEQLQSSFGNVQVCVENVVADNNIVHIEQCRIEVLPDVGSNDSSCNSNNQSPPPPGAQPEPCNEHGPSGAPAGMTAEN